MNNFLHDEKEMLEYLTTNINEFEKINSLSDINMLDYFKDNYKNYKLFMGRGYPSSMFFFELSNKILINLNIEPNNTFKDLYFAENTNVPIPEYWYKFCNFDFDNTFYTFGHTPITEIEYYCLIFLYLKNKSHEHTNTMFTYKKQIIYFLNMIR